MAASASRVWQTVRPHVPLIKFPNRKAPPEASVPQISPTPGVVSSTFSPSQSQPLAASFAKPIGSTPRGSGIEYQNLPARYRRRALDDAEIDYINSGGPS